MATEDLCSPSSTSISSKHLESTSSVLNFLADLTTVDEATLYSAEFTLNRYRGRPDDVIYSVSLCTSPFHSWCPTVVPPATGYVSSAKLFRYYRFRRPQSPIEDSDLPLQIAHAVGSIPGLTHVRFRFKDLKKHHRFSPPLECDNYERLLPVLLESICSPRPTSVLKRIVLEINSARTEISTSGVLASPMTIPSTLEILQMHCTVLQQTFEEDYANRIASFLRTNKSLKSLQLTFTTDSWQISSALETMMQPLTLSMINALGSAQHKVGDLVLQKLELVLEFGKKVPLIALEAVKIMTLMLDAGSTVGELSFSIKSSGTIKQQIGTFQLTMRIEHGALVELHVPACDDAAIGANVVEEFLRLNRGPNVLSLGPLLPPSVRKILRPLVPDRNGHQANTCVTTLKLLNISDDQLSGTLELQQERLEEVAKLMKLNSTVKHLEVTKTAKKWYLDPPQCKPDSAVVTQLQNSSTSGGNLRSISFYGKELPTCTSGSAALVADDDVENHERKKVQCKKYLKPDQEMNVIVTMERGWRFW